MLAHNGTTPVPSVCNPVEDRLVKAGLTIHDRDLAEAGVRALLRLAGEDPDRPGLLDTPNRVLKAWMELTGQPGDPDELLSVTFDDAGPVDEMVSIGPVPFTSLCEHHLLPFTGHAWVSYIPTGGVIGLSKVPRLMEHFARRVQVQERLTGDVADAIAERVPCLGVAVMMRATHTCATMRGVRKEAPMTTTRLIGVFRDDSTVRAEFLSWVRNGG